MKRFIIPAALLAGAATLGGLGLTASGATAPVVSQPKAPVVKIPAAPKAPVEPSAPVVPPTGTAAVGSTNTVTQSAPPGSSVSSTVNAANTTVTTPPAAPAPQVATSEALAAPADTTTTTDPAPAPTLLTGTDYSVTWYGSQVDPQTGVLVPVTGGYEGSQIACMATASGEASQGMQVGECAPHTFTYTGP